MKSAKKSSLPNISVVYVVIISELCILGNYFFLFIVNPITELITNIIPLILMLNLFLIGYYLVVSKATYAIAFLMITLLFFSPFLRAFISPGPSSSDAQLFKVISFNINAFAMPTVYSKSYMDPEQAVNVRSFIGWMDKEKPDIMCLQKYFNDGRIQHYNSDKILRDSLGYHAYFPPEFIHKQNLSYRGVAIFSKHDIVDSGILEQGLQAYYSTIYASVKIGNDTITIINSDYQSFALGQAKNVIGIMKWVHYNTKVKQQTTGTIIQFIKNHPHKIIFCSDLNLPYFSLNIRRINKVIQDSLQDMPPWSRGTVNSGFKLLNIIGVDYQFYSEGIVPVKKKVQRNIRYSDHFPVYVEYLIPK